MKIFRPLKWDEYPEFTEIRAGQKEFDYPELTIAADIPATTDLLGKYVTDLQTGVAIDGNEVTGTLKYVTGYTGFSEEVELQSGNYIALHCTSKDGATITVQLMGGVLPAQQLDSDGIFVYRITGKAQYFEIKATIGTAVTTKHIFINGMTLNAQ